MSDNGWIALHRKIIKWEWYNDANTFRLFVHLLLNANHEEKRWQGHVIKRGQLIVGRKQLAKDLKLSERNIRTSISKLKSTSEIATKATNKFTLVTLIKYEDYQDKKSKTTSKTTSHASNERPTGDHKQQLNNITKNNKNTSSPVDDGLFDTFWYHYKKKSDKKKARTAFSRLSDSNKQLAINDCQIRFNDTEKQFVPNPTTYIHGERWNDEIITRGNNNGKKSFIERVEAANRESVSPVFDITAHCSILDKDGTDIR